MAGDWGRGLEPPVLPVVPVDAAEPSTEVLTPPEADAPPELPGSPGLEKPWEAELPVAGGDPGCGVGDECRSGGVELDELEPAEPFVSANAIAGVHAIAAPTPRATASAPTRPMWLALPMPASQSAWPPRPGSTALGPPTGVTG